MEQAKTSPQQKKRLYRFAFAYLLRIVLIALLCVGIFLSLANDLYAFVKSERTVTLRWETSLTLEEAARELARQGVIENPTVFSWYVDRKGRRARIESFTGELSLNCAMSYREILAVFAEPKKD